MLISINLVGDIVNVLLGTEPRAIVGILITFALFVYLNSAKVRRFFWHIRIMARSTASGIPNG